MNRNYQKEMEHVIQKLQEEHSVPTLLLHSCCAPCSSYVLEYLSRYFRITVYYYNPNIYPPEEYWKRVKEQENFIRRFSEHAMEKQADRNQQLAGDDWQGQQETAPAFHAIDFAEGRFEQDRFYELVKGFEHLPEGGERCFLCYEMRLREAAKYARQQNMDYFTTTLSISPLKNAQKLNEIGEKLAKEYGVAYLCSDFKKKEGYKRSVELSKEYGMYRQDYCGCVFSKGDTD